MFNFYTNFVLISRPLGRLKTSDVMMTSLTPLREPFFLKLVVL